jgi:hypothetical protein
MKKKKGSLALFFLWLLIIFQALSGLAGGAALIAAPDGSIFQMPVFILEGSPFQSFLIPGLILFLLLGIFPAFTFAGLVKPFSIKIFRSLNLYKEQHWSWTFSLYTGLMLIVWIDIEVMIVGGGHALQTIYGLTGVAIVMMTLLPAVKKHYKIS